MAIKQSLKKLIVSALPRGIALEVTRPYRELMNYGRVSYAQEAEDLILDRIFEGKKDGFYIDIGAHHPRRFSNTLLFYQRGWRGINIDAMPGSMQAFREERPRDINLEVGVSETNQVLTYFEFNEPALNGFDQVLSHSRDLNTKFYITGRKEVRVVPLVEILAEHLPKRQIIDFMTIDVEGVDLSVLQSNDWDLYRPNVVLVECLAKNFSEILQDPVAVFLSEKNYSMFAKTFNTVFFKAE